MNLHLFAEILGIIGVILILLSYTLLQFEKIRAKSFSYSVMNLFGSMLILYSLFYDWNLPSVIIEVFWILISIFGIIRHLRTNRQKTKT